MTEIQYPTEELEAMTKIHPTDEDMEAMYEEFTRSYPEHSWIYPF